MCVLLAPRRTKATSRRRPRRRPRRKPRSSARKRVSSSVAWPKGTSRADEEKSKLLLLCALCIFFFPETGVKYTRGGEQSPKVKEAHQSQDRGPRRERETQKRTRGPRQPQAKTKTRSPSSEKEGTKRCARPRDRKRERPTTGFVFGKTFDCFGHPSLLTEGGSFLPGASTRWDGKKSASNASKTRGIAR